MKFLHFKQMKKLCVALSMLLMANLVFVAPATKAYAASGTELNVQSEAALKVFREHVKGSENVLEKAQGILVLPRVYKAGFGVGAEYGEGVLKQGGKTIDFYNMASASWGFQLGAQRKSLLLFFMSDDALNKFRTSNGWKAGVDASVAVINVGAEGSIDTKTLNQPVIAFVVDQKGLMYDLSLEGAKFSKIKK